ncbi:hypothetical protein, partial [Neisseria cinerea]|uniref:hypothetical protein n=1 Tax=Neisseria cinerea TaxID=483 RepID=UPI001E3F84F2
FELLRYRRFVSSEEPNYTLEDVYGQYLTLLFLIIFSISLSDKVFYFATNHIRLGIHLPPSYPLPFFLSYGFKITEKEVSDK